MQQARVRVLQGLVIFHSLVNTIIVQFVIRCIMHAGISQPLRWPGYFSSQNTLLEALLLQPAKYIMNLCIAVVCR